MVLFKGTYWVLLHGGMGVMVTPTSQEGMARHKTRQDRYCTNTADSHESFARLSEGTRGIQILHFTLAAINQ